MKIPPLPEPEEFSFNTACPWCGSDAEGWDPELGTDHDAPCCGKPIRWDYKNKVIHAERTEADKRYIAEYCT